MPLTNTDPYKATTKGGITTHPDGTKTTRLAAGTIGPDGKLELDKGKLAGKVFKDVFGFGKGERDLNIGNAMDNIQSRNVKTLELGEGKGTQRIADAGQHLAGTPQAAVRDAGAYTAAPQAAGYIQALQSKLGQTGPKSAIDATRDAATRKLEEQTYRQSIQDAQQLASQGQSTGARSQALGVLRGQQLAGNKAQLEADLQQDEAATMNAYEQRLLDMAQRQGSAIAGHELTRTSQANQAAQANAQMQAQRELQRAQTALTSGKALNAEEYQREIAAYQNALDQLQQKNTGDMLRIMQENAEGDAIAQGIGSALGVAGQLGGAALGKP